MLKIGQLDSSGAPCVCVCLPLGQLDEKASHSIIGCVVQLQTPRDREVVSSDQAAEKAAESGLLLMQGCHEGA